MLSFLRRLACDQRGVTVVEYALIVCLIATVAIGAMTTLVTPCSTQQGRLTPN